MSGREFLIVWEYGMGGAWAFASAETEDDVLRTFPEFQIIHETPAWLTPEEEQHLRSVSSFVVAEPTTYPEWVRTLISGRDCIPG